MALDLSTLAFRVDTTELDRAGKAIGELVVNVGKLDRAAKTAAQTEATLARAAKDNAKANLDNAKAQDVRLKSTITADQADQKAAANLEKKTKATEKATESAAKNISILQKQKDILEFQTQGFSKGQSSILAYAKASGVAANEIGELGKVLETQRKLMGGDPFDKSLSGLKSLKNQYTELKESVRQYATDSNLSSKQTRELARDKERLIEKMKVEGASFQEIRKAVRAHNEEYVRLASSYNKMTSAEEAVIKARKDAVNATNYLTQADAKLAAALNTSNASLDKAGTDSLVKYEAALRKSGLAQDVIVTKLAAYKTQLTQVTALEKKRQEQHLARALSPQLTDIGVSLYSGQSPMTVLLQQGGQIADLLRLSGVEAQNFGKALRDAFASMIPVMATVAKGLAGFTFGLFYDAGKAITSFIGNATGMNKVLQHTDDLLYLIGGRATWASKIIHGFGAVAATVFGAGMLALGVGVTALAVSLYKVIQQENDLVKVLTLNAGAMALTKDTATAYALALSGASGTTGEFIQAISEMAKAGKFTRDEISTVSTAAVQMAKYFGVSIEDTVKSFAKLKEDPVKNLIELAQKTGLVSEETLKSVVEFEKQGNAAQAASVAIKAMAEVNSQQVEMMKKDYNGFSLFIMELGAQIKQFFSNAFADLWRSNSTDAMSRELEGVKAKLDKLTGGTGKGNIFNWAEVEALQAVQRQLEHNISLRNLESAAMEEQIKQNAAAAGAVSKTEALKSKYITAQESSQKEIVQLQRQEAEWKEKGLLTDERKALITKAIAAEQEKIDKANKPKAPTKAENYYAALMREATNNTIAAANATEQLTKSELKLLEVKADSRFKTLTSTQQADVVAMYEAAAAAEKQAASTEQLTKAEEFRLKLLGKSEGIGKQYYSDMKQLEEFATVAGWSRDEIQELTRSVFQSTPAWKSYEKALDDVNKAATKFNEDSIASQAKVAGENKELDYRVSLLGRTSEEQRNLTLEYQRANKIREVDVKLARQLRDIEEKIAEAKKKGIIEEEYKSLTEAKIQAEQDAADEIRAINRETAVQYAEDLQKEIDAIKSGISDAIVTALFEGGKAGSKKLRDLLVNTLRQKITMVVDVGVNAVLSSLIGGAASSIAGGAGSSLLGSIGGSALTGVAGQALGIGSTSSLLGGFSGSIIPASVVGPTAAAPTLMSGLGNMASAIPGWGWAIAGIAALAGLMSKKATPHAGAASTYSAAGGLQNINLGAANNMGFMANYSAETQGFTDQIAKTLATALDATATSFGTTAGYAVSTAFADDTSKDGAWGQLIIQQLGKDLVNWGLDGAVGQWAPKEFGDGAEGQQQYMNAIALSARDALKGAIGDVRWAQEMLDALGDSPTIEALSSTMEQINQAQSAIKGLGQNIKGFADLTNEAVSKLVEASGGAQAFFANMQSYYDSFYSDAEKSANISRDISKALAEVGLSMPKTREEYRAMVEQQLSLGESGAKAAAELLKYASAFASITESQEDLAAAEQDRLDAALQAYKDQQRDLLQAQLDSAEEQMNIFQRLFDYLSDQVNKLYGSVTSTAGMQVRSAREIIQKALQSKTLPDQAVLEDAVGSITGSFDSTNYASKVDADRDRLRFAAQLDELKGVAGKNLATAKTTVDFLKLQLATLDDQTLIMKQQLDGLGVINTSLQGVIGAIETIGSGGSSSSGGTGGGYTPSSGGGAPLVAKINPYQSRAEYGADEALGSFEKFKAWYVGLRSTADQSMAAGYEVPDWLKVNGLAADISDQELFSEFLFFKNNPQYAQDFEDIFSGKLSKFDTSGKSLLKTDLNALPAEVRDYYEKNLADLLANEGMGADPVLAYQVAKYGAESLGLDPKTTNIAAWLQQNKWTEAGIVKNNNPQSYADAEYANYKLSKFDANAQVIVDRDGSLYTLDGRPVGRASREQMVQFYGKDYVDTMGYDPNAVTGTGASGGTSMFDPVATKNGSSQYYANLKSYYSRLVDQGLTGQQVADALKSSGTTLSELGKAFGSSPGDFADLLKRSGATSLPSFAEGGNYAGGLALVGEEGPELINFNRGGYVHTASQTAGMMNSGDVCAQLEKLNSKVEMLEAAARSTAVSNNKIAKILDRVSPDGNSLNVTTVEGSVVTTV